MKKCKNSRAKGKRGELELAHWLTENGFSAKRGQQFKGGGDSPDVICPALGSLHFEVKRVETFALYTSLAQAIRDAGPLKIPVVAHRRNGQDWVAVVRLSDLVKLWGF